MVISTPINIEELCDFDDEKIALFQAKSDEELREHFKHLEPVVRSKPVPKIEKKEKKKSKKALMEEQALAMEQANKELAQLGLR